MLWLGLVTLLVMDLVWITSNKRMYGRLVQKVQKSPLRANMMGAMVAYVCMMIGFVWIIAPAVKHDSNISSKIVKAIRHGGVFGFLMYAIFNATNFAIFKDYSIKVALIDTFWGTFVFSVATWVYLLSMPKL